MNYYSFRERLAFSTQANGRTFEKIISDTLPGVARVEKTDTATDKTGVDYVATLRRGATVNVDLKLRDHGCRKFWRVSGEELALETWSVKPAPPTTIGKVGWTLDESKATHYTLHVFSPSDSDQVFLLPFQLLRKAFRRNGRGWIKTFGPLREQSSGRWKSECLFVPASVVLAAIAEASISSARGLILLPEKRPELEQTTQLSLFARVDPVAALG